MDGVNINVSRAITHGMALVPARMDINWTKMTLLAVVSPAILFHIEQSL